MFLDRVRLKLEAGKGGDGVVSWTREKFRPKGGPCGGNGGLGGSIFLKASSNIFDLSAYHNRTLHKAISGSNGGTACRQGESGEDLTLLVPLGTIVKNLETDEIIADLIEHNQTFLVCQGGKGGLGNNFFKSSYDPAPLRSTPGKIGELKEIELELKLIADIGFVGLPNAGKSTLLNSITTAKVKVGDYPFTTLTPNLSYIQWEDYTRTYIADIPGLIKGASGGKGLGIQFLKHIERTSSLAFIIDVTSTDPWQDFLTLKNELEEYNPLALKKPFLIFLNKMDATDANLIETIESKFLSNIGQDPYFQRLLPISAYLGINLEKLESAMRSTMNLL